MSDANGRVPDFEDKTNINIRADELVEEGMRSGKHGHNETTAIAFHTAYAEYLTGTLKPRKPVTREGLAAMQADARRRYLNSKN